VSAAALAGSAVDVRGVVVRKCILRDKYVVLLDGGSEDYLCPAVYDASLAATKEILKVEFLEEGMLSAVDVMQRGIEIHVLRINHRVNAAPYDHSISVTLQPRRQLWPSAVELAHRGYTDDPKVIEAFKRMQYAGEYMEDVPGWFEEMYFGFTRNKTLERYAQDTYVPKYKIEDKYVAVRDDSMIKEAKTYAVKLDLSGKPLAPAERYAWNERNDRKRVAGAVTLLFESKIGLPCMLGTFPLKRNELTGKYTAPRIAIGKKGVKARPNMPFIIVGYTEKLCPLDGIDTELELVAEFIFPDGSRSRGTIPWMEYTSASLYGRKLRYRALPAKYLFLRTINSLQGRGCRLLLLFFDYVWTYHTTFTAITRATEPPPMVGETIDNTLPGCIGIKIMPAGGTAFFDPCSKILGMHPRVARYFDKVLKIQVPPVVLEAADKWHATHIKHHLTQERLELTCELGARQQRAAGTVGRSYF